MLDIISPDNKKGFFQGIYATSLNLTFAVAPLCLGLLSDATSIYTALWVGAGITFSAAFINAPLLLKHEFQPSQGDSIDKRSFGQSAMMASFVG